MTCKAISKDTETSGADCRYCNNANYISGQYVCLGGQDVEQHRQNAKRLKKNADGAPNH